MLWYKLVLSQGWYTAVSVLVMMWWSVPAPSSGGRYWASGKEQRIWAESWTSPAAETPGQPGTRMCWTSSAGWWSRWTKWQCPVFCGQRLHRWIYNTGLWWTGQWLLSMKLSIQKNVCKVSAKYTWPQEKMCQKEWVREMNTEPVWMPTTGWESGTWRCCLTTQHRRV